MSPKNRSGIGKGIDLPRVFPSQEEEPGREETLARRRPE
jgi:hypothetical protein